MLLWMSTSLVTQNFSWSREMNFWGFKSPSLSTARLMWSQFVSINCCTSNVQQRLLITWQLSLILILLHWQEYNYIFVFCLSAKECSEERDGSTLCGLGIVIWQTQMTSEELYHDLTDSLSSSTLLVVYILAAWKLLSGWLRPSFSLHLRLTSTCLYSRENAYSPCYLHACCCWCCCHWGQCMLSAYISCVCIGEGKFAPFPS